MKNIVNKVLIIVCFFWIESARSQVDSNTLHLNYSSGKSLLLAENLNLLAEYYNIEIAQAQIDQAKLWNNPLQRNPDITLARNLLGWEPKISLRDGLQRMIKHFVAVEGIS